MEGWGGAEEDCIKCMINRPVSSKFHTLYSNFGTFFLGNCSSLEGCSLKVSASFQISNLLTLLKMTDTHI